MFLHAARQPILNSRQELCAYELLFRDSTDNLFPEVDGDAATSKLVAASQFEYSLPQLTAGKTAHINFNLKSMLKRYPSMIPADQVVIEIVDIEKPGKRLLEECRLLHEAGYKMLLDDYVHQKVWLHFFPYISMLKIDMLKASVLDIRQMVKIKERFPHIQLVAGKIETRDAFEMVKEAGFDLFQGYFFAEPQQIQEKTVQASDYSLAELLFEISNKDMDLQKIVSTFQSDVNLSYKLLRYSNSAVFKREVEVSSIKQAIVSLGKEELIKFVTILFAAQSNGDKPSELLSMSLLRAKFCEELASVRGGLPSPDVAFLSGMFSLLDVMLDEPMQELVEKLKLSTEVAAALLRGEGDLASLISVSKSYEEADWALLERSGGELLLSDDEMAQSYQRALAWTDEQMSFIA
ncbi:MAG: EAL and HDOD domain-containing protein [Pseudomonadales bacterium]